MPTLLPSVSDTELKAEAIAEMCLGHSARKVEKKLKARYPGNRVPR